MQKLIFVSHHAGVSKKGREYNMVRFSDGIDSFIVSKRPEVSLENYVEGDEVEAEIHVEKSKFGDGINGTLVAIK